MMFLVSKNLLEVLDVLSKSSLEVDDVIKSASKSTTI